MAGPNKPIQFTVTGCPTGFDPIKAADALQHYVTRWELVADGEPFRTHSSWLQPVRYRGMPAMLKIAFESEERWGAY